MLFRGFVISQVDCLEMYCTSAKGMSVICFAQLTRLIQAIEEHVDIMFLLLYTLSSSIMNHIFNLKFYYFDSYMSIK